MEKTYFLRLTLLALLCSSCSTVQLNDLPNKVLYSIFNQLELPELVHVATLSTKMLSASNEAFKNQFQDLEMFIEIVKSHPHGVKLYVFRHVREHIHVYDYEFALTILRYFGTSIRSLRIGNHYVAPNQAVRINKFANRYAAGAVTSLNLGFMRENTLAQFTTPFERVENLTCDIFEQQIGDNILPFDQLFPRLKRLTIKLNTAVDHKYLDCTLPQLEHLAITTSSSKENTSQIDNLIRKNAHIKSIEVAGFAFNYIEFISNTLPNVENVTIRNTGRVFPNNYAVAPFQNVKHFVFDDTFPHAIDKLIFPQLESVKLFYSEQVAHKLLSFFTNHPNITKLQLNGNWQFNEEDLMTLIFPLAKLVELTTISHVYVSHPTMHSIIDDHEELNDLKMRCKTGVDEQIDAYVGMHHEWVIRKIGKQAGISFKRRV